MISVDHLAQLCGEHSFNAELRSGHLVFCPLGSWDSTASCQFLFQYFIFLAVCFFSLYAYGQHLLFSVYYYCLLPRRSLKNLVLWSKQPLQELEGFLLQRDRMWAVLWNHLCVQFLFAASWKLLSFLQLIRSLEFYSKRSKKCAELYNLLF